MSQDFTDAKRGLGSVFPEKVYDSAPGLSRVEPSLTAKILKERFLWGIPLVSPITKEKLTDAQLRSYLQRAACVMEIETKLDFTQVVRRHRLPFDPALYQSFICLEIPNKPISKVLRLAICSSSYQFTEHANDQYPVGAEIYRIPNEWVEMGNALRGTLNVNPINPAFTAIGTQTAVAASGAAILQFIGQIGWVPAYWVVECVHGFVSDNGQLPVVINEIIGTKAAIMLLSNLIPLYHIVNQSLNIDGLGQSVSNQMYQMLQIRLQLLQADLDKMVKTMKTMVGNNFMITNV